MPQRGGQTLNQNLLYDPRMKKVSRCAAMPNPVFSASAAMLADRVYVMGGCTRNDASADKSAVNLCQAFDTRAGKCV